ncbi:Acyl-CoA dehydrogenase related to the alkylation response protein AidB [Geosmithia morbida]|uniref:Acyl-CoA dehydrogenase related to the alkylation response protein AidB n=1 Tax=Geosmithia morbida TaxID=1094350 RepID=A0A9P4Z2P6_9HYPO|nr:Acyl-CoA dehydrogenase related to the alkylation response protein AidB [Geosmithia morbida]KAF4126133.1 Acyl-CoA dehydrogenase related to the alkylation response protein AidB [Geosmithia morbida]
MVAQIFTTADVASHNKPDNLYTIVDGDVYDLTTFQEDHPGGKKILQRVAGKDASKQFWKYHNDSILNKYKGRLQVGSLDTKPKPAVEVAAKPAKPATTTTAAGAGAGAAPELRLRTLSVREWVENDLEPNVTEWDEAKRVPEEIYKEMGRRGYLAGLLGVKFPEEYAAATVRSVDPKDWDQFHEMLLTDELARTGSGGFVWNLIGGFGIGCPPVVKFGSEALKARILPGILAGDKRICLAITEPDAGSDVANLTCEAKLSDDGKHFIVNGEKKWITNGIWSDYFTTAVRTGGEGMNGVSLLLIERTQGVTTRRMDCQGVWSSGTTYITFEDVKVPVENLLGKKNQGFRVIMSNFNHERIGIIIQCIRFSRVCYEESVRYANKRRTFGKKLIDHPVIRMKLAHMARQIEASYNWLENLIFQAENMSDTQAMLQLGGPIAGLKAQSTVTFEFCAREASQIFGGLSYSRGGQGAKIERLYRDVRAYAIPGGSEEIMLDLSMRQSLKVAKATGMKL